MMKILPIYKYYASEYHYCHGVRIKAVWQFGTTMKCLIFKCRRYNMNGIIIIIIGNPNLLVSGIFAHIRWTPKV